MHDGITVPSLLCFSCGVLKLVSFKQVSRVGISSYIPQITWDVIICPCPWLVCQKQVSSAGTSNYILQILRDVITCLCPWYLLPAQHSQIFIWKYIPEQCLMKLIPTNVTLDFTGASLKLNGAPGNIQGNLTAFKPSIVMHNDTAVCTGEIVDFCVMFRQIQTATTIMKLHIGMHNDTYTLLFTPMKFLRCVNV